MNDDFTDRLIKACEGLEAPVPSETLLVRILEDHARGLRGELPKIPRKRPFWLPGLAAAALILIATMLFPRSTTKVEGSKSVPLSETMSGIGLWPEPLFAQGSSVSELPPLPPLNGSRMAPGRWTYVARTTDDAGIVNTSSPRSVIIAESFFGGAPSWLFIHERRTASPDGLVDTVWLSREDLHPQARHSPLMYGASLATRFDGDSLTETWYKHDGDSVRLAAALPTPRLWERTVAAVGFEQPTLLFMSSKITESWQGSYAGTGINNAGELITFWLNLKVTGEELVHVPAGDFQCWKIMLTVRSDPGYYYWVDKASGWIVKEERADGLVQRTLVSYQRM